MLKVFNQVPNKIQSFLKSHNVHPNLASSQDFAKKIPLFSPLIILRVGNFAIQNWNYPVLDCNFQAYKRLAFQREFIKHGLLGQLPASLHPLLHWHIPSQWTSMERPWNIPAGISTNWPSTSSRREPQLYQGALPSTPLSMASVGVDSKTNCHPQEFIFTFQVLEITAK